IFLIVCYKPIALHQVNSIPSLDRILNSYITKTLTPERGVYTFKKRGLIFQSNDSLAFLDIRIAQQPMASTVNEPGLVKSPTFVVTLKSTEQTAVYLRELLNTKYPIRFEGQRLPSGHCTTRNPTSSLQDVCCSQTGYCVYSLVKDYVYFEYLFHTARKSIHRQKYQFPLLTQMTKQQQQQQLFEFIYGWSMDAALTLDNAGPSTTTGRFARPASHLTAASLSLPNSSATNCRNSEDGVPYSSEALHVPNSSSNKRDVDESKPHCPTAGAHGHMTHVTGSNQKSKASHCGKARVDGILTGFAGHQRLNGCMNTVGELKTACSELKVAMRPSPQHQCRPAISRPKHDDMTIDTGNSYLFRVDAPEPSVDYPENSARNPKEETPSLGDDFVKIDPTKRRYSLQTVHPAEEESKNSNTLQSFRKFPLSVRVKDFVCVNYIQFNAQFCYDQTVVCILLRNSTTMREVTCSSTSVYCYRNLELCNTGHMNGSNFLIQRGQSTRSLKASHITSMSWKQVQVLSPILVSITANSPIPVPLVSSITKACLSDCDSNFKASPLTIRGMKFTGSSMPFLAPSLRMIFNDQRSVFVNELEISLGIVLSVYGVGITFHGKHYGLLIWVQVEHKVDGKTGGYAYLMSSRKGETGRGLSESFQKSYDWCGPSITNIVIDDDCRIFVFHLPVMPNDDLYASYRSNAPVSDTSALPSSTNGKNALANNGKGTA
ncbi:hypothetical protein CLF_102607, partial [Clonorchis sinensis]